MRGYWLKIIGGALGVFVVGMVIRGVARGIHHQVDSVVNSSSDISIPLMGIVPLSIQGARLGHLNKVVIERDAPKHVSGIVVVARLDDSVDSDRFSDCDFTAGNVSKIDQHTTFTCLDSVPAGMQRFGTVRFVDADGDLDLERPLVLGDRDVADIQDRNGGTEEATVHADSIAAWAESVRTEKHRWADSLRRTLRERYRPAPAEPAPPAPPRARSGTPAPATSHPPAGR